MPITHYSSQILMEVVFAGQISKKYTNFTNVSPVGAQLSHAGRHVEGRSVFSQFCQRSKQINASAFPPRCYFVFKLLTFVTSTLTPSPPNSVNRAALASRNLGAAKPWRRIYQNNILVLSSCFAQVVT